VTTSCGPGNRGRITLTCQYCKCRSYSYTRQIDVDFGRITSHGFVFQKIRSYQRLLSRGNGNIQWQAWWRLASRSLGIPDLNDTLNNDRLWRSRPPGNGTHRAVGDLSPARCYVLIPIVISSIALLLLQRWLIERSQSSLASSIVCLDISTVVLTAALIPERRGRWFGSRAAGGQIVDDLSNFNKLNSNIEN
jgi:hypothetical protein